MRPLPQIPQWIRLEHEVAQILTEQELHGWYFDQHAAWKLASTLRRELEETVELLRNQHPFVAGPEFTPKRNKHNITRPYRMDSDRDLQGGADKKDSYWEADYRRDCTEGDRCVRWATDCFGFSEMSRYYEELGDDLRRHQRMAQAMYDC